MKKVAGMNGFGRFGLHLLKYWLDRSSDSSFSIKYINDDTLTIEEALKIIQNDEFVVFNKYNIKISGEKIRFLKPNGEINELIFTNDKKDDISWIGEPNMFFECSGKNTIKRDSSTFLVGKTEAVIISATSWDADETIVFGFNHKSFDYKNKVISYGSCTVNAYVPLANYINDKYGIIDSDVNVIHNIQKYRLQDNYTLNRKFCTLEKSGALLLPFINENNFLVNYTVIPYPGVSIIDYRFRIRDKINLSEFYKNLKNECDEGTLKGLYNIEEHDLGPEVNNCTIFSSVFIKQGIKVINDQVYIFSYFDNENSVNRYFDLVTYISNHS
tara:strand:- start:608 stop:1591 length:984 start_codon:yes stop_codon:yes gene_type:complete